MIHSFTWQINTSRDSQPNRRKVRAKVKKQNISELGRQGVIVFTAILNNCHEKSWKNSWKTYLVGYSFIKVKRQTPTTLLKQGSDMDVFLVILKFFSEQLFCEAPVKDCLRSLEESSVFDRETLQYHLSELATDIRSLKEQPLRQFFFCEATRTTAPKFWLFPFC